jgi:hypothetical protein
VLHILKLYISKPSSPQQPLMPTDMTSQPTFPQFALLPAQVRRDIWERAAAAILATRSLRVLTVTRRDVDPDGEAYLARRAWRSVMDGADPDRILEVQRDAELALQRECRRYRMTLFEVAPSTVSDAERLATYSASWTFGDVASTCTEARDGILEVLELMGRRRSNGIPSLFDASKDVVCLKGPETFSAVGSPFFGNSYSDYNKLQRQVVAIVNRSYTWLMSWNLWGENRAAACSPSLGEICPALLSLRRVAFVYRPGVADTAWNYSKDFAQWLALDALWPYNLPKLEEIYLVVPGRLRPDQPAMTSQKHRMASVPNFAGTLGTYYEIDRNRTDLWEIQTQRKPDGLPTVFDCAERLQEVYRRYNLGPGQGVRDSGIVVKVLGFVPHA